MVHGRCDVSERLEFHLDAAFSTAVMLHGGIIMCHSRATLDGCRCRNWHIVIHGANFAFTGLWLRPLTRGGSRAHWWTLLDALAVSVMVMLCFMVVRGILVDSAASRNGTTAVWGLVPVTLRQPVSRLALLACTRGVQLTPQDVVLAFELVKQQNVSVRQAFFSAINDRRSFGNSESQVSVAGSRRRQQWPTHLSTGKT